MKKILLLHPVENMNGNLRWASREQINPDLLSESLQKIRRLGYWASAFPEGDGITFSKDDYLPDQALADFRNSFDWLEIEECMLSELTTKMSELLAHHKSNCKVLVPIRKLWIEQKFQIGEFKFWPPVERDGALPEENPWFEYFVGCGLNFMPAEPTLGQSDIEIQNEIDLLRYPLIELDVEVNESDLLGIQSNINSQIRLLRIASEQADRALDLLRITHCHYKKIEFLPDRAGQLDNGFTVAYVIPKQREYSETLLQHIVYPLRASNNWLGLEADYSFDPFIEWIATIIGNPRNEIEQLIRSSITALSQAFYTVYEEARFLSLVFALDALCSPDSNWKGWKHRTYIASIISGGNINSYESNLREFEYVYSDIRNKLVHAGSSFIYISVDPNSVSEIVRVLIIRCIKLMYEKGISSVDELQNLASGYLKQTQFQVITNKVIDYYDNKRGKSTAVNNRPKW